MSEQEGYTLIELLCTLALVGVIGAFTTPSFLNQVAYHQTRESALTTLAALNLCRSQAITSQRDVACDIQVNTGSLETELHIDLDENGTMEILAANEVEISASLVDYSFTNINPVFNKFGFIEPDTSLPTQIAFCNLRPSAPDSDYVIELSSSGFLIFNEVASGGC